MFSEFNLTNTNIMLSGGAVGADTAFGKAANAAGHQVVHWVFAGHKTKLRKDLYKLSKQHLLEADQYLIRSNKSVNRRFPSGDEYTNDLLRRNYYQVKWSESVYAVSRFGTSSNMLNVNGGTTWAMQMYADRFLYDQEPWSLCSMFMFDMNTNNWYQWNKIWSKIEQPPEPKGVYAGVGSRDLSTEGLNAIQSLYAQG